MQNIEKIKQQKGVNSQESFAFYAGQVTFTLLDKSKSGNKKHALIEPFINVSSPKVLAQRLLEMFNKYKHEFYLNDKSFNSIFEKVLEYAHDNDFKMDKNIKTIFFIGYLGETIIYKKNQEQIEE